MGGGYAAPEIFSTVRRLLFHPIESSHVEFSLFPLLTFSHVSLFLPITIFLLSNKGTDEITT